MEIINKITQETQKENELYKTDAEYKAYLDGLNFALDVIKDTSYVIAPSTWEITFVDSRIIRVQAGEIVSCINELLKLGEPIEEVVKFECLPETNINYYKFEIVSFDENNLPYTEKEICIKADMLPTKEKLEFEFEGIFDKYDGEEIRNVCQISEKEALELFGDEIIDWS